MDQTKVAVPASPEMLNDICVSLVHPSKRQRPDRRRAR